MCRILFEQLLWDGSVPARVARGCWCPGPAGAQLWVWQAGRDAGVGALELLEYGRRILEQSRVLREKRLSETLGEQAWRESGLAAPAGIDQLSTRILALEQQDADLHLQLGERDDELSAARAANRELMARLNTTPRP